jgi:hypothetical protein
LKLWGAAAVALVAAASSAEERLRPAAPAPAVARPALEPAAAATAGPPLANVHFSVSKRILASLFEGSLDSDREISENILGMRIVGSGRTRGEWMLELVPNDQRAQLNVVFEGQAETTSRGFKKSIVVNTTGVTRISALKTLYLSAEGITCDPSDAQCSTSNQIRSISAPNKLVRWFAKKKVAKSKPEAEAIASRKAESLFELEMDAKPKTMLVKANAAWLDFLRTPLEEAGAFPSDFRFSTTEDRVVVAIREAAAGQQAASTPPPPFSQVHDVDFSIHETAVANLASLLLGGKTITDHDFATLMKGVTGEVTREFRLGTHMPSWSVVFSSTSPLTAVFRDGQATIQLGIDELTVGDDVHPVPVFLKVAYRMEATRFGPRYERMGEVECTRQDGSDFLPDEYYAAETLLKKFNGFFTPEIFLDGLVPPSGGAWEWLGRLRLGEISCRDGWYSMGYGLRDS